MPLKSNRHQDYRLALDMLVKKYPDFLKQASPHATRALIAIMEAYVKQSNLIKQPIEDKFNFNSQEVVIVTDYSAVWDLATYQNDYHLQILDIFTKYFQALSKNDNRADERKSILNIIVLENRLAVLWRCLLKCGIAAPKTFGREIWFLCLAVPILTAYDTTNLAGDFLKAVFVELSVKEREQVEQKILSIPNYLGGDFQESSQYRDRLLGCLDPRLLVTPSSKKILEELASKGGPPANKPMFSSEFSITPYREQEYLLTLGVDLNAEPNRHIQVLEKPIRVFSEKYQNSSPDSNAVEEIFPSLKCLYESLKTDNIDGVDPHQSDHAWGRLAEASKHITKFNLLSCETELGIFIKKVLIEASAHTNPVYSPKNDAQFNEFASWDLAARIEASEGLIQLVYHSSCVDDNVLNIVEQLSRDPVPAVRFQIASRILTLYQPAEKLMRDVIKRMCLEETNCGVLQGLLPQLSRLASNDGIRTAELVKAVFDRIVNNQSKGAWRVKTTCISIFTGLHLWQNSSIADEVILKVADDPTTFYQEAQQIVQNLRECLVIGSVHSPDPLEEQVRRRAFAIVDKILGSTLNKLQDLEIRHQRTLYENWITQDQEIANNLAKVIDTITTEVFFASGAFDDRINQESSSSTLGRSKKERFLKEASLILDNLSSLVFPHTIHQLLETLVFLVDVDPEAIFLRVGKIVCSSQSGSYQHESLGADLIVSFIERFIAEYRYVLLQNEECRKVLIDILDKFVGAGWSNARRLAYHMEEIFR